MAAMQMVKQSGGTQETFDLSYARNAGNDIGISTVGFRSSKHNPEEWHNSNYAKYYESLNERELATKGQQEATDVIGRTDTMLKTKQADNTKKLAERLKDINFWKAELEREIRDIREETDLLVEVKRRLERSVRAIEIPLHIATDNLSCRSRRQGEDLVQDQVEILLLKEVEIINNAQDLLKRTVDESLIQIKRSRDAKEIMEMDWSDKKEAEQTDSFNARLRNEHTHKQHHPGVARFQEIQSTPESWAQYTHDNVERTEHERLASIQLRALSDNIIADVVRDMRQAHDAVCDALRQRIAEYMQAIAQLEDNISKVIGSIGATEKNIAKLKEALRSTEDPLKVAETRLYTREKRQNIELTRDPAQFGLIEEVNLIGQTVEELMQHLAQAEDVLQQLQQQRKKLEVDLANKRNTLFIDKEKCLAMRGRYPTIPTQMGYQ